jgi:hypothetical protein
VIECPGGIPSRRFFFSNEPHSQTPFGKEKDMLSTRPESLGMLRTELIRLMAELKRRQARLVANRPAAIDSMPVAVPVPAHSPQYKLRRLSGEDHDSRIEPRIRERGKPMFTKSLATTATILASAAALTLLSGCSSGHEKPTRVSQSRHHRAYDANRSESRDDHRYDRENRDRDYDRDRRSSDDDFYQPVGAPVAYSEDRAELGSPAGTEQLGQDADTQSENGETRANRVTVISAEEPPLTKLETPSRTIRGDEFWIAGHWIADPNGFTWHDGRIEQDRTGELFVDGGWAASPRGWEYTPEYWR